MKKFPFIIVMLATAINVQVYAKSCPLTNNQDWLDYKGTNDYLKCSYQNGRLVSRTYSNNAYDKRHSYTTVVDYFSNGIVKEYAKYGSNMGGELYIEQRKYNTSGMLIDINVTSGSSSGYRCRYANGDQLQCVGWGEFDFFTNQYKSVEYASQYDWN